MNKGLAFRARPTKPFLKNVRPAKGEGGFWEAQ
jgi:hypothetical protein